MNGQNKANQLSEFWYKLVLRKLKRLMIDGSFLADEVRYIYGWDKTKSNKANLQDVRKEDAALRYFEQIGLVSSNRIDNEFRKDGRSVWGKTWDEADPAYRTYEWIVGLYGIDNDRFEAELEKFSLEDAGAELSELKAQPKASAIQGRFGQFIAHKDGSISYKNKPVVLKPSVRRLVFALILEKGKVLSYEMIIDVLWNDEHDTHGYLENSNRNDREIKKRIGNLVSEANHTLYGYSHRKHLVPTGETSYKLAA